MEYRLQLPDEARIHPVFHISLLKEFMCDPTSTIAQISLPLLTNEIGPFLQPNMILQTRVILRNVNSIQQAL